MNKILYISIFIIHIFISSLFAKQTNFTVSYDPDYAPFSYLEDNKPEGLFIDYWKLWAEKNNYKIEFVNGKLWDNALSLVYLGRVDFFLGTTPYETWMNGSKTYYNTNTSLFIHKNNSKGFSKNASYIIGIIGNDYLNYIKNEFPNSEIIVYKDYPDIFKDFTSKKIDLIYDDKTAVEFYALRNNNFHQIKSIDLLTDIHEVKAIAKEKKLIKIFNEGFEKISLEELHEIESKWILNEDQRFYKKSLHLTKKEKEFIKENLIKISLSDSWRPFNFKTNGKPDGISYEFWKIITNKTGIRSQYNFFNTFTEQLESIKNKSNDMIYSVGKTKEKENYSLFTKPYISFPLSIATLKDENFIENIDYLFNKRVAVGKNFTAHNMIKEKYPNINLLLVENIEDGLKAVSEKKAFAYIDIKPSLTYNIRKLALDNLKISGNTGLNFDLSIMIRDDYPILKSILDKTIDSLKEDEISSIIHKWENVQFEKTFDYTRVWIILAFLIALIILLTYKEFITSRRNKKLESLVNLRTKDLKKLTQTLEQRVEEKTKELKRVNYILDEAQKIAHLGSFQYNFKKNKLTFSDELFKILKLDKNRIKPSFNLALGYVHNDDKENVERILQEAIATKQKVSQEFKIIVEDKIKYIQSTSKITKYDEDGNPIIFIGTLLDLTKIKNLEIEKREQDSILAQQAKMAAMGEMLENIAHQWRQPLSVISTASTGLQLQIEINNTISKQDVLDTVTNIHKQTLHLSKTIDDFRNFFNPNKIKLEFDIKTSIDKTLYLIKSKQKTKNVNIIKDIQSTNIFALENELIQVLLNIFNNAIDAFDEQSNNNLIFVDVCKDEESLVITIKDNAGGIKPKIIDRIFEPYFTTKHKSQGTGIGLYMSNEIITKHLHGSINVTNKSYTYDNISYIGAAFTIRIPLKAETI